MNILLPPLGYSDIIVSNIKKRKKLREVNIPFYKMKKDDKN